MSRKSLFVLLLAACTPTASLLEQPTGRVEVLPPLGPTCAERCVTASELCTPFALTDCQASCTEARGACLEAASADCLAARACARPPPSRPFSTATPGLQVKDLAGPVTLQTTEGAWNFEREWTGDDSYLFLAYANSTRDLFQQRLTPLLTASPRNVQYLFGWLSDQAGFNQAYGRWLLELQQLPVAERDYWRPRVHFIPGRLDQSPGWIGAMLTARAANPPMYLGNGQAAFGIDRQQRLREVGMLGRLTGSGVAGELPLLQNEARAFNFEFTRDTRLAQQQATVIPLADAVTAHDTLDFDLLFPPLGAFDTLEVDLALDCPGHQNANCGAWDSLSHLRLCTPAAGADGGASWDCNRELARWITTYWREGRWVTDISQQLPALGAGGLEGGPVHLRWTANGQFDPRRTDYIVSLSLRLSNSARARRPTSATPLWTGGNWNASYDAAKLPVTVNVPAPAKRVELVTLTTGHGGVAPTNCAEFCNHQHLFTVNGVLHRQAFPEAQAASGCAQRVDLGVVPNQHGTWYYGRGGWCPGQDVAPWVVDVTADVTKGQPNTLSYRTEFNGAPVTANLGNIVLSSWLVVWE